MKFGFNNDDYRSSPIADTSVSKLLDNAMRSTGASDTIIDHALRYVALGWYVLPVRIDKTPVQGFGLNSATNDPDTVRSIWTDHPEANIAVACEKSGLVVVDIDPRNGGLSTINQLEDVHGRIYSAVAATTQGGGQHRFFKADPAASYPGTLGFGVDVKHKGYVLVEPSHGESGVYKWMPGRDPTQGSVPSDAPLIVNGAPRDDALKVTTKPGSVIVAPETYDELVRALATIPPEIKHDEGWLKIMQAMTRLHDKERAYRITREWSLRSTDPKHTAESFDAKWRSLNREDSFVSPKSVFYMADQNDKGWRDTVVISTPSSHPLSLRRAERSGAGTVTTLEYVFDRFMSTGVNIIAGAPGVGKTTLIVPLALATAHLCPADHPLKPRVRRNVIIITESVVQVQRVIYSLAQWGFTGMHHSDFDARVRVISARRLDPKLVSEVAAEYAGWTCDNTKVDGSNFPALPLVVFDTANAVLELESENDNAEVGRAMAHIKQAFSAFPVIIVAHTSKALGRGEAEGLSTRGASAWTGDAQGTYMVFKDGEDREAPRVLKTDKVRFPTAFDEMMFALVSHKEEHPNVLGELEDEWFTHSVARPLARGERAQIKEDNKELKQLDDWVVLCDEMLDLVRSQPEHSRTYYEQLPKTRGGPRGSQERKERAMTSLINDGCIKIVMLEKPKGRSDHYLRVDEEVVNAVVKNKYEV